MILKKLENSTEIFKLSKTPPHADKNALTSPNKMDKNLPSNADLLIAMVLHCQIPTHSTYTGSSPPLASRLPSLPCSRLRTVRPRAPHHSPPDQLLSEHMALVPSHPSFSPTIHQYHLSRSHGTLEATPSPSLLWSTHLLALRLCVQRPSTWILLWNAHTPLTIPPG